jgi:hypothetical protein
MGSTKSFFKPARGHVEGAVLVSGTCLRPDDWTLATTGELDLKGPIGQTRVLLFRQLHVHPLNGLPKPLNAGELLIRLLPESGRNVDVPSANNDLNLSHCPVPSLAASAV